MADVSEDVETARAAQVEPGRERPAASDLVVTARPIRWNRYGNALGVFVFAVFVVIAFVMKSDNAGAWFNDTDQWFTALIGLVLGGFLHLLGRPRLRADERSVRMRGNIGTWRTVPWDVVVAVEFPKKARFARLRLPGDELLVIYAVQRADREDSVAAMRGLRELFARTHPDVPRPS